MKDKNKAIILIAFFFLLYFAFGIWANSEFGTPSKSHDFKFHFQKLAGNNGLDYKPVYYLLFWPFSSSELLFYFANLVLILVLIPALLYKFAKNWLAVLIYFCAVSLAHDLIFSGSFPEALILLFVLIYLNFRYNFKVLFVLLIAAEETHSTGFMLFIGIAVLDLLNFYAQNWIAKKREELKQSLTAISIPTNFISLNSLISIFLTSLPIPVLYFGAKKLFKDFDVLYYGLIIASFILAGILNERVINLAQLVFCIIASQQLNQENEKNKKAFFILCIALTALFLTTHFSASSELLKIRPIFANFT